LFALKPLAKALLRSGIGFREFSEVAKVAYVQTATEDYGLRGRPTNISRVSVMTGLTRKEVKRIRESEAIGSVIAGSTSPPADLLHYWFTDDDYLDHEGKPSVLHFDQGDISFSSLVKRSAGDIPPGAMRTELIRVGVIADVGEGMLRAINRNYVPTDLDEKLELGLQLGMAPLLSTIAYNCDSAHKLSPKFQRIVDSSKIRKDMKKEFQHTLTAQLAGLLESIDEQLTSVEVKDEEEDKVETSRLGVGVFFFSDD